MSKSEYYTAKSDLDEFDSIGEKLAADLRRSIRHLVIANAVRFIVNLVIILVFALQDNYPVLSDPWIDMAEVFGRVAHISEVESALPSTKKDATLWETEEQALRFLMEDGKLNLCLRILIEFKIRQIDSRKEGRGPMVSCYLVFSHINKQLYHSTLYLFFVIRSTFLQNVTSSRKDWVSLCAMLGSMSKCFKRPTYQH